ncbi:hypothetical protein [Listeria cornellensis]|uniref:Uncharacterized protein n=1 Tax=Listeria cornellensis FSL F6-0969 TaxID=1265820 RepID=W7BKU9_9LIST|nr:hypothetical protein [Listeria cornellensis]EUJ26467.1 hypothetical protein PCORN_14914 [Listeria cornellensis FSL F6-0969]
MLLNATIISFNADIEEEIIVKINDVELTCFIGYCPIKISRGESYPVELSFFVIDSLDVKAQLDDEKITELVKLENARYLLKGFLSSDGILNVGFNIKDELLEDYQFLFGEYVELEIDRMTIDFG